MYSSSLELPGPACSLVPGPLTSFIAVQSSSYSPNAQVGKLGLRGEW